MITRVITAAALALVVACGGATPNEGETPVTESAPVTSTTPRHARATRGAAIVEITDTPGILVDSNAPPPPPGVAPATHVALTASCGGDVAACSEAGTVVRAATSFDGAVEGLRAIGFEITITP